jgi:hypothetical protein
LWYPEAGRTSASQNDSERGLIIMSTTFKQLKPGQVFEFDHVSIGEYSGIARGPWVKEKGRRYTLWADDRQKMHDLSCTVGSINVKVLTIDLETCPGCGADGASSVELFTADLYHPEGSAE